MYENSHMSKAKKRHRPEYNGGSTNIAKKSTK